jgi:signal peptidase I
MNDTKPSDSDPTNPSHPSAASPDSRSLGPKSQLTRRAPNTYPFRRWFLFSAAGLIVFLGLSILLAGLLLLRRANKPKLAMIAGSSMEPTLVGPRIRVRCPRCSFDNRLSIDAWQPQQAIYCLCCQSEIEADDPPEVIQGEQVHYQSFPPQLPSKNQIQRWDLVVYQSDSKGDREVKRVVGLPGETVSIEQGRIVIDGHTPIRTPTQFMDQAILIEHWSIRDDMPIAHWLTSITSPLRNDLTINPHDSHSLIPCADFGISLRVAAPSPSANLHLQLNTLEGHVPVDIAIDNDEPTFEVQHQTITDAESRTGWKPQWLHLMVFDGYLVISDEQGTIVSRSMASRIDTPRVETEDATDPDARRETPANTHEPLIQFVAGEESVRFDLGLVYRGRVYRGFGDMPSQLFPNGEGYVVLGDNVSISQDSRGAGASSSRVPRDHVLGILRLDHSSIELLLRQANWLPGARCQQEHSVP